MNPETLKQQLQILRLPIASQNLEDNLSRHKKAVSLGWIAELLQCEIDARREAAIQTRIKRASFPEITSIENFDFTFNPSISEEKIRTLATLKFIEQNQIALFLGQPGTGKTHLAIAIGVLAATAGFRVFSTSAKRLNQQLIIARAKNSLDDLFRKILSAKLWILDDWGMVSFERQVSEEIFDLFDRRKHSSSMILTSNRDVSEWPQVFPEPVLAGAAIDRIFDRADITIFKGKSYRLKGKINIKDVDLKISNP
jgi:DNA replication protein DnaC